MKVKQLISMSLLCMTVLFYNFSILCEGTRKDALSAYNAATSLQKTNPQAAIDSLEKAICIAEKLDSNGVQIVKKATKKLPKLYYSIAAKLGKQKQYDAAISAFGTAIEVSNKYENKSILKACNKTLPKMHFAKGYQALKAKDYSTAIAGFDKSLELNPDYIKANYSKGLALKGKGDVEGALAEFDKVIANEKMSAKGKKVAFSTLKSEGKKLNKNKQYDSAIKYLNMALDKYKPTYKDAATESKKLAGVYFQLANAYNKKGNKGKACSNYRKAAFGPYKKNAEYKINTELKCK